MTLYYSQNNGFLDSTINDIPSDAVQISDELHKALIEGQTASRKIIVGSNGLPMLSDPDLAVLKKEALSTANQQYQSSSNNGFDSKALGDTFHYTSTQADQQTLISYVITASNGTLYCQDKSGTWAMREHTADQVKQVLIDMNKSIEVSKKVYADRLTVINNATSYTDLM